MDAHRTADGLGYVDRFSPWSVGRDGVAPRQGAPREPAGSVPVVGVIGGGCAGTLVAANLLRGRGGPLRVVMIERSGRFGPGVAYTTDDPQHLLNVPAQRMSAFGDDPGHFVSWAAGRLKGVGPASYLSRGVYGEYLRAVLTDSRMRAAPQRTLETLTAEAVGLHRTVTGVELALKGAAPLACDRVVLATGAPGVAALSELPDDPRIIADPWAPGALRPIRPTGLTLVIGTGLTAVDAALSACAGPGRVLALSRGGQFPHVHLPGLRAPAPPPILPCGQLTLAALERRIVEHVRATQGLGYDWRDAFDGLRPVTPELWAALPTRQRRRFLRERRRAWDARRHRMAPVVGSRLRDLLQSARLERAAGRVQAARSLSVGVEVDVAFSGSGQARTFTCQRVVVCTGAGIDIRRSGNPLLAALLLDGSVSADPLALGLRTTDEGALLDSRGYADGRLLTLGALRRGELWETTAVEEIRNQAERLARTIERSSVSSPTASDEIPSVNGTRAAA